MPQEVGPLEFPWMFRWRTFQHTTGTLETRPPTTNRKNDSEFLNHFGGERSCLGYAPGVCWGSQVLLDCWLEEQNWVQSLKSNTSPLKMGQLAPKGNFIFQPLISKTFAVRFREGNCVTGNLRVLFLWEP